jgi:hypothetical protein
LLVNAIGEDTDMPSYSTTGLTGGGTTGHYQVEYDTTLDAAVGQAVGNALVAGCDSDFDQMTTWFGGIPSPWSGKMKVRIRAGNTSNGGTGAEWPGLGGPITLIPGLPPNSASASVDPWFVRYLLVSEAVEMFMETQGKDWYGGSWQSGGNEGSAGEGLSRFLGTQFLLANGRSLDITAGYDIAFTWLTSAARADYVNHVDPTLNGFVPQVGCAILFIYYLHTQLGFTIEQIVGAGSQQLGGVYKNLTGDASDPFPYFKQLLEAAFPGTATITSGNLDDPYPLGSLSFWAVKDTYGRDEATDIVDNGGGRYPDGFALALEGFNRQVAGSVAPTLPTIAFNGVTTAPNAHGPEYQSSNPYVPQRILFPYDVLFTAASEQSFPSSGETPAAGAGSIVVLGKQLDAETEFFFTAGADPYFANVGVNADGSAQNVPWLSQDLRVFTATPALNSQPVPGAPQFVADSFQGAYEFIQDLIAHLNDSYGDPAGTDPFDATGGILPGQVSAYTGDSSVTPVTHIGAAAFNNYNFAVARVRLRGSQGTSGEAQGVKVFFRLWGTQTADTGWNPGYTYLSHDDTGGNPLWPQAPSDSHTIPFFATGNAPDFNNPANPEYGTGAVNNRDIEIEQGDRQWAYFGCFLNLYDPSFEVNGEQVQKLLPGDHHCLVAQIAYAGAPIENVNGVTMSPENSDKLAQRNLQVSTSDNPGDEATHRVPQTFDVQPSAAMARGAADVPDELMIDWGDTPPGTTASIYWPEMRAKEVLALSARMYGVQVLSAADAHTIQCTVTPELTYVPIPTRAESGLVGLLTLDLPADVVRGQEFDVVVRRVATRELRLAAPVRGEREGPEPKTAAPPSRSFVPQSEGRRLLERYVAGSFQVKIPVSTKHAMLPAEEDRLAIFKARLDGLSSSDRWHAVLARYVELLAARVDGLGGDSERIRPSLSGYGPPSGDFDRDPSSRHGEDPEGLDLCTGRIGEVLFDCFGSFEGFVLCDCDGDRSVVSREAAVGELALRACRERLAVSVLLRGERLERLRVLAG